MSLSSEGHRRGAVSVHTMSAWDSQPAAPGLWAPGCQDAGQEAREELQASGWTDTDTAVLGLKPGSQPGSPEGHLKASKDEQRPIEPSDNREKNQGQESWHQVPHPATQCGGWVYSEQIWATT